MVLKTIDSTSAVGVNNIISIVNDGSSSYTNIADMITDGTLAKLPFFNVPAASPLQITSLLLTMDGLPTNLYKFAVKISAELSATCGTNEANFLTINIGGYPAAEQTLNLKAAVGGTSTDMVVSTQHFAADNTGALSLTLTYAGSPTGTCGSMIVGSIAVVGYLCDSSCTCSMNTSCSCSIGYLTANNVCGTCPSNCQNCTALGCSVCNDGYYLLGTSCHLNCGNGYFNGLNAYSQPVCLGCASICSTCINPTICLTCSTGLLFNGGNNCGTSCPFGQYSTGTACLLCNINCATCTTAPATCTSCGLLSGVQSYLYSDSTCKTTCPGGTYADNVAGAYLCVPCPVGCALCSLSGTVLCS
jgi:hypothetical protein